MQKTESIWRFGDFTAVNSRYRNRSGTTEKTEIFRFSDYMRPLAIGYYKRINRPRQRYDYECSLSNAYDNLLESISWSQYEQWKADIDAIKAAIDKMESYGGTPRS